MTVEIWITNILGAILSFFIVYSSIPFLIKLVKKNKLYDIPDNDRKIHKESTPTLGGVAITTSILISFPVAIFFQEVIQGYHFVISAVILLFLIGFKDDLMDLSPKTKILAQLFVSALIIFGMDLRIISFGGVFGVYELSYLSSVLISLITYLGIINSFNMIDGIDGLAAGIGIIASGLFGISFLIVGELALFSLSLICVGAMLGFLSHNFAPAKIFMGDTGSLPFGLLIAIQGVFFINLGISEGSGWMNYSPVIAIAGLIVPLYDTLRVMVMRLLKGKSPMSADRSHVHHHLLDMGMNHKHVALSLYFIAISFIAFNIIAAEYFDFDINALLVLNILICFSVFPTNMWKRKLMRSFLRNRQANEIESMRKILDEKSSEKKESKELVEEVY